ncbi:MAG: DUF362 domain-containing protein [Candidatus Bathyarchaeota archaeon]|jgi:uncharacterized protein (DUF362 family)
MSTVDLSAGVGKFNHNPFVKEGKALVSIVESKDVLKKAILRSVDLIGGFEKIIEKGDEVLLKPNFNTGDSPPGSSDPSFVKAVIELLYDHGAEKVILGESSMLRLSTRSVLEQTGMIKMAQDAGADVVSFDEGKWVKVETGGRFLKEVSLSETALKAKKVVYVCCMKTHRFAKFTLSLKLAVGFMKPNERMRLHMRNLEAKIADLNLVVHPNLMIMDGRRCFISGGPAKGDLRCPNVVLASGDRVAMDVEALKFMRNFNETSLQEDPWNYTQIKRAVELGLGVKGEDEYLVLKEAS